MDQQTIASMVIDALKPSGDFQSVELIGSVANSTQDALSDIDILIADDSRPPWENVELASTVLEKSMGVLLRDWARSLIPEKYLISHFIPGLPILWWIDLGCLPSREYGDILRSDIAQDRNGHLAKLLVMNAKHYIRGDASRLRIAELHQRACCNSGVKPTEAEMFRRVYESIDCSGINKEFHERTKELLEDVANKAAVQGDASLKGMNMSSRRCQPTE